MIDTVVEDGYPIELHVKNGEKEDVYELYYAKEEPLLIVKGKNGQKEVTEELLKKCIEIGKKFSYELLVFKNKEDLKKEEKKLFYQEGFQQMQEDEQWFKKISYEYLEIWHKTNFFLFLQNKTWKTMYDLHRWIVQQMQEEEKETITVEYNLVNISITTMNYRMYYEGLFYWLYVNVEKEILIDINQKRREKPIPPNNIWKGSKEEIDEKKIKENLHQFFKKIKETQRIKNIYNPPTHHQEEMVKELIRPMEYRVQLLEWIKTIYRPLELEHICAKWRKEKKVEAHRYPLIEEGTLHIGFFGPHAVLLHEHDMEKQIFYFKDDQQGAIETYEKMLKKDLEKEKIRQEKSINQLKKLRFS